MQTTKHSLQGVGDNVELSIIVPTLNEGAHIRTLLNSLRHQSTDHYEVIVVDGGSRDGTSSIAKSLGARVFVLDGSKEFEARNYAASHTKAPLLVFSCADVVFPPSSLENILHHFHDDEELVALTGPDLPYDGGPGLSVTYRFYNTLRFLFSRMPLPLRAFSSSTNFLVVRRDAFEESGGFRTDDVNADGRMGRYLAKRHRILFDNGAVVYISARRALNWGMARFSRHYFYVLENFLPWLSGQHWFQTLKSRSGKSHGEIHSGASSSS